MKTTKLISRLFTVVGLMMVFAVSGWGAINITSSTVNGGSNTTVAPSATISANVAVTLTSGTRWRSTSWRVGNSGGFTCVNHGNHDSNGDYTESFSITAPASTGTYNATFRAYTNNSCDSSTSSETILPNAVIVVIPQAPPTDIALSANSIAENQPAGTNIGTFSATDPNSPETFTYTLVSGTGSTDNGSFTISGTSLRSNAIFDYEIKNSYSIRVRVTDSAGNTREEVFAVNVTDVAEISCSTLRDQATLTTTNTSYTNSANYNNSSWNVGPSSTGGVLSRAYKFTVDGPGTVDINLTRIDNNQAKFSVSQGTCPTSLDGLTSLTQTFTAAGTFYVYIYYIAGSNTNIEHQLDVVFHPVVPQTPPTLTASIPDQSLTVGTAMTALDLDNYFGMTNGDAITYTISPTLPAGLTYDSTTHVISGTPTTVMAATDFTVTATDNDGSIQDIFRITVSAPPLMARANAYTTTPDTEVSGNFITDNTGAGVDSGQNITALTTPSTPPSQGTVVILPNGNFTYTPNNGVVGTDSFTYVISDSFGSTANATVTITIAATSTTGVSLPFHLVNPANSRNLIGNYKIAGNTVLCLTEKTSGYGGTCHGDTDYQNITSNNHVVKYLDIDSDARTWNSTSSTIVVDPSYDSAQGVVWAGLFWGGRISKGIEDDDEDIRYAVENGANFSTITTNNNNTINLITAGANDVKLKVNNGTYTDVAAAEFHEYDSGGGKTYAAFANVTSLVKSAIIASGEYDFTVANLTTMEGREGNPGAFGGWSLVVIYAEDFQNAGSKPRNISIYNGFVSIGKNDTPIQISGFRLPSAGPVQAQLSVFSGEGEYEYGRNPSNNEVDWMKINDNNTDDIANWDYMPGLTAGTHVGNRDNLFDAKLNGINRRSISGEFNDLATNNVGVDVDNFDVGALVTGYRDREPDINDIFIKTYSSQDYVTTNMIAFSSELYVPKLCYDYTLDIDGYVLPSVNNEIKTPFGGFGKPLTTTMYVRSLEGDLDLQDVNVNYSIGNISQLTYSSPCSTEISEVGQYNYTDACAYTYNESASGFSMYIGTGKTATSGGVIAANEDRYMKWESDFHTSNVNTNFTFSLDYSVNYGSGSVPLHQVFSSDDLCPPSNTGFFPELGLFNVVDADNPYNKWSLYTQVAKRPINFKVFAYADNYLGLISSDLNLSVEVEMIRADNFNRDADTACNDQHSILSDIPTKFAHFDNAKSANVSYFADEVNLAYRSVAMRVWYLTVPDGSGEDVLVDDHNCTSLTQTDCEKLYADVYTADTQCHAECNAASTAGCYDCLRTNYGRKVCSRDNFAIRPEAFKISILDSNESDIITKPSNTLPTAIPSSPAHVIAGYNYRFDINASNHQNNVPTPRYIQHFEPGSATHGARMLWYPNEVTPTSGACNDPEDKNITTNLFDGTNINYFTMTSYVDKVSQAGEYRFEIFDENWTSADWNANEMLHHADPDYFSYYTTGNDCAVRNSIVYSSLNQQGLNGCLTSSVHTNVNTGEAYTYHYARYYPYTFDTSSLISSVGTSGANLLYINTPNADDQNMSYNMGGTFRAVGKDNIATTNFVDGCYAEDITMSLNQFYQHDVPTTTPNLSYDLIDYNTSNPSVIIRPREQGSLTTSNISTTSPLVPLVITQGKQYFEKSMQAAITMDLGYNFPRSYNVPLNPRLMYMDNFRIAFVTPPTALYVDLDTNYQIVGEKTLNQDVTFLYARAKSAKDFYEDITTTSIPTPISVVTYCDLGFTECQNRGIMSLLSQTNETDWWLSINHNTGLGDGDIALAVGAPTQGSGTPSISPAVVNIVSQGEDETITVSSGSSPTLPLTVPVNLITDPTQPNFTNDWLIYNRDSNIVPNLFYRVQFIGNSGWTGYGETGNVVGSNANTKKLKRLEW